MMETLPLLTALYAIVLCVDEPAVSRADLHRFPDIVAAEHCHRLSTSHLTWLGGRCQARFSDTSAFWDAWQREAEFDYRAWDYLLEAHSGAALAYGDVWICSHLQGLRQMLGRRDYWLGRMPPCMPWHRFDEWRGGPRTEYRHPSCPPGPSR